MKEHHVFHQEVNHLIRDLRHIIGDNLHHLRQRHAITLQKLAQKSQLSADIIDRIELGKGEINLIYIARLSVALDIDLLTLFAPQHSK